MNESAGKSKGRGGTGHGNRYLARVLGEAAVAAGKTNTFLGQRYRQLARRRGKRRHPHQPDRRKRNHVRQLEALGYKVTVEPAA